MIRLNNISPFLGVVLGALMLSLVTLLNGQPFFFPDTTTYVREADAAVVWALGSRFATTWTDPSVATTFEQDFDASKTLPGWRETPMPQLVLSQSDPIVERNIQTHWKAA